MADCITPAEMLRAARAAGFTLRADKGRLIVRDRYGAIPPDWAAGFREHKDALLVLLEQEAFLADQQAERNDWEELPP
jgi:hypothetical protein